MCTDGLRDRQRRDERTDMTKLMVAFRNFAKSPNTLNRKGKTKYHQYLCKVSYLSVLLSFVAASS
jgi:hypothetical protein